MSFCAIFFIQYPKSYPFKVGDFEFMPLHGVHVYLKKVFTDAREFNQHAAKALLADNTVWRPLPRVWEEAPKPSPINANLTKLHAKTQESPDANAADAGQENACEESPGQEDADESADEEILSIPPVHDWPEGTKPRVGRRPKVRL